MSTNSILNNETRPIDPWDNCDCDFCKQYRNDWIKINKRALEWIKQNVDT